MPVQSAESEPPALLKVACLQTCATPDGPENLRVADQMIRAAADRGAAFICLPEAFDYLAPTSAEVHAYAVSEARHPAVRMLSLTARELGVWILAGSISVRADDGAVVNRSLLFSAQGDIHARYDKIHLFDVDLPEASFRESDFYRAGNRAVTTDTPWGRLGLTICYDVRFPQLHRTLAGNGAGIIAAPAAFSSATGPLHWEPLLRARAIETGAFVLAPAQCGRHYGERFSHGHSLIIDPWGRVLAEAADTPEILIAELDLSLPGAFRASIPSLANGRAFEIGDVNP